MPDTNEMMLTFQAASYIEHPISQYRDDRFLKFVDLLHSADVSISNL
ncbi:MAG: hypothetical protein HY534_02405, partial [Chloroflexi bacterium]|nr:hypothetical protein [Chloroflexota bacterium]